jgi:DNA-binding XRE family transcriptional regulator
MAGFPKMLREDRERAGLTVDETAWRLGVTRSEYQEFEAGKRFPTFPTWNRICKLFRLAAAVRGWGWTRRRHRSVTRALNKEPEPRVRYPLAKVLSTKMNAPATGDAELAFTNMMQVSPSPFPSREARPDASSGVMPRLSTVTRSKVPCAPRPSACRKRCEQPAG